MPDKDLDTRFDEAVAIASNMTQAELAYCKSQNQIPVYYTHELLT